MSNEIAGRLASINIVGSPVAMTGEACTDISEAGAPNTKYRIANILKRLLDTATIPSIFCFVSNSTGGTGTNSTTIKITSHGLSTGDAIKNATRAGAFRTVTKVDANTLTVQSITGQTTGDSFILYSLVNPINYTVDYLRGIFYNENGFAGDIVVSSSYLPQTTVATAHEYSYNRSSDVAEITPFLATNKKRLTLEKYASGTLSQWDVTNTYFLDALTTETPVYLVLNDGTGNYNALLAYINSTELKAAIGGAQDQIVQFISANEEVS